MSTDVKDTAGQNFAKRSNKSNRKGKVFTAEKQIDRWLEFEMLEF